MQRPVLIVVLMSLAGAALAAEASHADPVAPIILGVTAILVSAVIGRYLSRRLGQPSVLGELIIGITLGNLIYLLGGDFILVVREGRVLFDMIDLTFGGMSVEAAAARYFADPVLAQKIVDIVQGPHGMQLLSIAHTVDIFSRYGVIFLMFLVGLETSVEEMRSAGVPSLKVALAGMLSPFLLGLGVAWLVLPDSSIGSLLFIGATLGATSVGITARVLTELDVLHSQEARVILGAAIFDDVLGLIALAIVSGIVISGSIETQAVLQIVGLSALFIVAVMYGGPFALRTLIAMMRGLQAHEAKIFVTFIFVMGLSWFADLVGLATIIGAFAAGVIMNDAYFAVLQQDGASRRETIKSLMDPLEAILVPIFFVLIGLQVKLESFLSADVWLLASGLIVAAIVGKLVSGVVAGRRLNRLAIGIGMLPRGEVGLIFASIGKGLGVIDGQLFSAIVLMVVITTVMAPSLLKWSLRRGVCENVDIEQSTTGPK
ncbi:MAG: cation:proton antiporter [Gammaproteobacteria bacterium]|nr:cation:proton antiporter [Gammaproteobacteria bacterium]